MRRRKKKYIEPRDSYNFGQQFFYWHYFKNHDWFITAKYDNLKDELITNDICSIDLFPWNLEYESAINKLRDDEMVKNLRSNGEFKNKYGIDENVKITVHHLLAILFYCNTNDLQYAFSATYRKLINVNNETDSQFKQRHRHYFHFGKYLREIVEVYGDVLVDDTLTLYHGIDHPLYFTKMIAKFYGPTSTSQDRMIAARFAGDDGMILEFGKYLRNSFYFDCFLSGYDREREFLFIGGYAALKIKNILHFINKTNKIENYSEHLASIQCLFSLLMNESVDQQILSSLQNMSNNILLSLIKGHRNQVYDNKIIPHYIAKLFHFRCSKIMQLNIDLSEFVNVSTTLNINQYCTDNTHSMVNINFLAQLFPNLTNMRIIVENNFVFEEQVILYLYQNLVGISIRSLPRFHHIEFCFYMKLVPYSVRDQMTGSLIDDFEEIGWMITIQNNEENVESVYFVRVNTNYVPSLNAIPPSLLIAAAELDNEELKEPLLELLPINNEKSTDNYPFSTENVLFHALIPYQDNFIADGELAKIYPFVGEQHESQNWRGNILIAMVIALICTLSTVSQFIFILYGASPYRWITLGLFICCHLLNFLMVVLVYSEVRKNIRSELVLKLMNDPDITSMSAALDKLNQYMETILVISLLLFPLIPLISTCLLYCRLQEIPLINKDYRCFIQSTLWAKCWYIFSINIFQAFPQMIMLTIMICGYGYELDLNMYNIINWTFLISALCMISFCIVLSSVFDETSIYILNAMWLILDYFILLFILSVAFYDDIGFYLFICDIVVFVMVLIVLGWFFGTVFLMNYGELTFICCYQCCFIPIGTLFVLICCPVTMMFITVAEQFGSWGIFPFCLNISAVQSFNKDDIDNHHPFWMKYQLFQWIKNAENTEERGKRLCCANMVFLDNYNGIDRKKFVDLKNKIENAIQKSMHFGEVTTKQFVDSDHERYNVDLSFGNADYDDDDIDCCDLGRLVQFVSSTYLLTRIIHFLMPIATIIYIGYHEKWKTDNLSILVQWFGTGTVTFYIIILFCILYAWSSTYYHRLIIPTENTLALNTNYFKNIANCHIFIDIISILTEWFGSRDIVNVILKYMGTSQNKINWDGTNDTQIHDSFDTILSSGGKVEIEDENLLVRSTNSNQNSWYNIFGRINTNPNQQLQYHWRIAVKELNTAWLILIGIVDANLVTNYQNASQVDGNKIYFAKNTDGYGVDSTGNLKTGGLNVGKYCEFFEEGDVIDMYFDTKEDALWYGTNGKDFGIAYKIDTHGSYRLAIALFGANHCLEILSCHCTTYE